MKKITFLFIVFLAVFTLKTSAQDLSFSFESSEGFTLGEVGGQNNWIANPTYGQFVNVVDTESTDGNFSIYFSGDPNGPIPNNGITGIEAPAFNFTDVTFSVDLFLESGVDSSEFDVILQSPTQNALTSRVAFLNGEILIADAVPTPQFVIAGSYTNDVWFKLKIIHDFTNGALEYYIDDALLYTGNVVNGTIIEQMLLYSSFNQTGIYVDNINFTSNTMSVEEFANINLEIYPNPTTDAIYIKSDNTLAVNDVHIYDLSGRKFEANLNADYSVNVDYLSSGNYLLVVDTDKGTQSIQFIKK